MDVTIKKNILDLNYQKCLVIISTTVVILFTYIIGIMIAFLSGAIKTNSVNITYLILFTFLVMSPCLYFFINSFKKLRSIPKEIEALN
ncbi:hypothetical protein J4476_04270 [Candidatus Woesearchaeota archaeon]|nr:MAG: hypothetical protein QT09_C0014G0018 [archaeon GW2011_AR18]MBS3161879.1 hypothetical protein [Candidatus Woesearchaeota archaeon]HIH25179.1 hypothetical protein [Nanoarchaeota archaeon]